MRNFIKTFQRINKKGKSGSGACSKSKWFAFDHLMFLQDKTTPTFSRDAGINDTQAQVTEDNNVDVNLHEELPTQTSRASSSTGETSSSIVSAPPTSVAQHRPSNKRRRNTMAEEAYSVMKEMGSNLKKKTNLTFSVILLLVNYVNVLIKGM
ncbi:uncharacterized protein LOC111051275 isoform X1 [Nilaparvata lugens]|uniref:uncharacterized protein LOC111051275 isoform X1 n=1 Tax=Nilaparvata lugens TaxID=108931 RepID=UPI00193DF21B|nr:uncharacterized protein LOC111051275 isoform X1 [Nilaparvata lugens]